MTHQSYQCAFLHSIKPSDIDFWPILGRYHLVVRWNFFLFSLADINYCDRLPHCKVESISPLVRILNRQNQVSFQKSLYLHEQFQIFLGLVLRQYKYLPDTLLMKLTQRV